MERTNDQISQKGQKASGMVTGLQKRQDMLKMTIRGVGIVVFCLVFLMACGQANMGPKVWEAVKPEVTKNLKFPDSAKFGEYKDAIIYEEDGKYHVLAEVTSKNALGIEVADGFEAIVTVADGNCSVGNIEFYDNSAFNTKTKLYEQKRERKKKGEAFLTSAELDEKVKEQGLFVTKTNIIRKKDINKYVSGDYLQAVIQNNSDDTILSCVIAFACWCQRRKVLTQKRRSKMTEIAGFLSAGVLTAGCT